MVTPPLPIGTRVKLNARGLRVFPSFKEHHVGTVCGVCRQPNMARIKWDHLKIPQNYHAEAFLEVVTGEEGGRG